MEGCHTSQTYIADGRSRNSSGPHVTVSHLFKAVVTMKVNSRSILMNLYIIFLTNWLNFEPVHWPSNDFFST